MAKIAAVLVLALATVAFSKPMGIGGIGVAHKTAHVSSHIVSPYLGFGMLGYPGIGIGHTVASHSIGHVLPHFGHLGMMGLKGLGFGMFPMGIGLMG